MEEQLLSLPINILPFHYCNIPKEFEFIKNQGDDIIIITKKQIIIFNNYEEYIFGNDFKDIFIHGDIDNYHRIVVVTTEGRLLFLRESNKERNEYEEFDINFFIPEELKQRKGCKIIGIVFYHVESFEIRALIFTNDKCIFTLSFFTNQFPINAKTKSVYISSTTKDTWSSFSAIETINGVVVVCCDGKELGRIIFDKMWNGSYEVIEKIDYETKINKGNVEVIKRKDVYDVIWNSSQLVGINPNDKEMKYKFNDILTFDLNNEIIMKKNSLKPFQKRSEFGEKLFELSNDGVVKMIDEINGIKENIRIEGKGQWMINDDEIMWILSEECLFRINLKNEKEMINLNKLNEMKNEEEVRVLIHKEFDECNNNSKKKIILYCWCILMDIKVLQIQLKKNNNEKYVKELLDGIKNTLQLNFKMKIGIDFHIIRYIIEMSGIEELFIDYCNICNDIDGYINYLIKNGSDGDVYKQISLLFNNSSPFVVSNQKMKAQHLLEKYFSILYYRNSEKTIQFLSSIEFCIFPSFFTALASFKEQKVSISFARQLLNTIEAKNGFHLGLCEYIFWGMIRHCSDQDLLEFMKEKPIRFECVLNLPLKHHFKNHKRSYLFILEYKQMKDEIIEVLNELISEEKKQEDVEKAVELILSIENKEKQEDYLIRIFNNYIKSEGNEKNIMDLIKKYSIPIDLIIDLLPAFWSNEELIQLLTESIESYSNEIQRTETEINKTIEITNSSFDFNKSLLTCNTNKCCLCNETIKAKEEFVLFSCSHLFHPSCIKKEYMQNKTSFALIHQNQIESECPLCGEHQIELIEIAYDQPNSYWEL